MLSSGMDIAIDTWVKEHNVFIPLHSAPHLTCLKRGWRFTLWPMLCRPEGIVSPHASTYMLIYALVCVKTCDFLFLCLPSTVRRTVCSHSHG